MRSTHTWISKVMRARSDGQALRRDVSSFATAAERADFYATLHHHSDDVTGNVRRLIV